MNVFMQLKNQINIYFAVLLLRLIFFINIESHGHKLGLEENLQGTQFCIFSDFWDGSRGLPKMTYWLYSLRDHEFCDDTVHRIPSTEAWLQGRGQKFYKFRDVIYVRPIIRNYYFELSKLKQKATFESFIIGSVFLRFHCEIRIWNTTKGLKVTNLRETLWFASLKPQIPLLKLKL